MASPLRLLKLPCLLLVLAAFTVLLCRCDETTVITPDGSGGGQRVPAPAPAEPSVAARRVSSIRVLLCPAAPASQVQVSTTGGYSLSVDGTAVAQSKAAMPAVTVSYRGGAWVIGSSSFPGRSAVLAPTGGAMFRVGQNVYRGSLCLLAGPDDSVTAINHVELEAYLAGVLPKELYAGWAPATYEALAVAARTFAIYNCLTASPSTPFDLGDNESSQCYGGFTAETPKSWAAVNATKGVVLSFGPAGQERVFLAQYSACCGGRVNGAYVIRNAQRIEPLEGGQPCDDCAACSRYRWPAVRIKKADILRALAGRYSAARLLRRLERIDIVTTTPDGRAVWVDVVGDGPSLRVRAEDIRLSLLSGGPAAARGINSMNCRMVDRGDSIEFADGRGFGHGVGLCQWGAQGKAVKGWSANQILAYYYPGAKLYRVD